MENNRVEQESGASAKDEGVPISSVPMLSAALKAEENAERWGTPIRMGCATVDASGVARKRVQELVVLSVHFAII